MAKLSEKFSGQHIALFVVAGSVIMLNLIDSFKAPKSGEEKQMVSSTGSKYNNPTMSWYQRIFCRGYKTSLICGSPFLHPMREEMESEGKRIKEGAAPDGVIVYRGFLKGAKDPFRGKLEFDPND